MSPMEANSSTHINNIAGMFLLSFFLLCVANGEPSNPKSAGGACPHGQAMCGVGSEEAAKLCPYMASKKAAESLFSSWVSVGVTATVIVVGVYWLRKRQ